MSRFLAIDWDHGLLHVVAANVGRGGVQIQQAHSWTEEHSPGSADAGALGAVLRARLKEAGIAPAPALVAVGRDRVVLKDIRYPQVSAAEEPAIVRFQAAKELTESAEDVAIDYAPISEPGAAGERRAQVLIFRRHLLDAYQGICKGAGLTLAGVVPRSYGIAACAAQLSSLSGEKIAGAVAVLTATAGWAEFCVARDGQLLFARPLAPGQGLVADIRRNLALYAGQPMVVAARDRVHALYVFGDGEQAALRQPLQELLAIPVHPLDPLAGAERALAPGGHGGFAGVIGLLHAQASERGLPINFAAPKDVKPTRNPHRERILVGAVVALLVLVVGFLVCNRVLAARNGTINDLKADVNDLDERIAFIGQDSAKLNQLEGWTGAAVSWLDELADLSQRFPEAKLMHVKEFAASTSPGKAAGKKPVAVMSLNVEFTGDELEVSPLMDRLRAGSKTSNYRIVSKSIMPSTDEKTPGTVSVKVEIERKAPEKTAPGQRSMQTALGRKP